MSLARNIARLVVDNGGALSASNLTNAPNPILPGTIAYVGMNSTPTGWLKANGAAVSRTTYADLFSAIGTTYGAGNGSTTFNLPDLRGEFIRGFSDGRSVDSGRTFGSFQKGSLTGIDGPGGANLSTPYANTGAFEDLGVEQTNATEYPNGYEIYNASGITGPSQRFVIDAGVAVVRPRNLAMLACIKY